LFVTEHGVVAPHGVVCVMARQPFASSAHVTTAAVPEQYVPPLPPQTAGGVGHVHAAAGKVPPHGLPVAHVSTDF
jgi:hypothetical protein